MGWPPAQAETDHSNVPFMQGEPKGLLDQTIEQDAGRSIPLASNTLMAQRFSDRKWVPITDVDPTLTFAKMVCGAFGSTPAAMQAITDGEFAITMDGVLINITALDFSEIDAPTDAHANAVLGAFGSTAILMQAITDGSFQITVDGQAFDITGLDFSPIEAGDDTHASALCGANGANLAAWQAIGNGGFAITVDGRLITVADADFTAVPALTDVAARINSHIGGTGVECRYNVGTDVFSFVSSTTGEASTISVLAAGGTTDISGAGFLNGTGATLTQGVGGDVFGTVVKDILNNACDGFFTFQWDGTQYTIISEGTGEASTITALTAGSAGTDISGAAFLNGLTGVAVLTQGTGGEPFVTQMVDIINAAADGRYSAEWNGVQYTFVTPTPGTQGAVTVLTAVAGGAGTDISGAGHLNGLTGVGTVTTGTGDDGEDLPTGIYRGSAITAAALVAGDVTGNDILVGGPCIFDEDGLTIENSLTMNSIVVRLGKTIRMALIALGLNPRPSVDVDANV
jgi:hypothetical protein